MYRLDQLQPPRPGIPGPIRVIRSLHRWPYNFTT
jgi:hypothetical protein